MLPADVKRLPGLWPAGYDSPHPDNAPGTEPASTSVQPPETKSPDAVTTNIWGYFVTSDDAAVTFRHSGWAHARSRIRAALDAGYPSPRGLQRFDLCGSEPWVAVDEADPTRFTILTNHCHSRWCVPCSRERASRIVGNLVPKITLGPCRFLTLTMKHSDTPLRSQIDRIYSCFRKLRRAPFWQAHVDGGAAILEIKHSHRDDLWHVHLHCLIQGRYCRHSTIKAEWWRITGDSNVVDIRPIHNTDVAIRYITKYVTKPIASTIINKPEPLAELVGACSRRRLVLTWGTWRGLKLSAPLQTTAWTSLYPLDELFHRVDEGDESARVIVDALVVCCPDAPSLVNRSPPLREWPEDPSSRRVNPLST